MSTRDQIVWVDDFIVLDAAQPAETALQAIQQAKTKWVVISRYGGTYLYAFTIDELWRWPALIAARARLNWLTQPFGDVLDLHEEYRSTPAEDPATVPPIDRSWRPQATAPSIGRYIRVGPGRNPNAIGYLGQAAVRRTRGKPRIAPTAPAPAEPAGASGSPPDAAPSSTEPAGASGSPPDAAPPSTEPAGASGSPPDVVPPSTEPATVTAAGPVAAASGTQPGEETVLEDEGTTPVRYPAIEADRPLVPGKPVVLTVDLTRARTEQTQGEVNLGEQPEGWTELTLTVIVSSPVIDPDGDGRGNVTVRRNAPSKPATITGTVRVTARPGESAPVVASFFHGTRFCGTAMRTYVVSDGIRPPAEPPALPGPPTRGTIVPQPNAAQPDVTVRVSKVAPNELDWLVETARFDGLPPKLRERKALPSDVDTEVSNLFNAFATLTPGDHVREMQSFGTRLWNRAPRMFHDVYWAMWDHYRRPLTIQFITNEPYLPWELMRPMRNDESEIHLPLALAHPVARWLEDYDGYMRNELPAGGVFTIAPKYQTVSRRLPRAQTESAQIVATFGATQVPGTRAAVTALLETLPAAPVAVLHFAGHGQFMRAATTQSSIKLEDGALTASEVDRPEVKLGTARRTLVFFNACEVGATGTIFGEVGGWAAAFLGRQFGGFIAPLWSVEDEDAGVVAEELLTGIVSQHHPIGEVLRALRAKHGKTSPTFYSYLYYGDVTASLAR